MDYMTDVKMTKISLGDEDKKAFLIQRYNDCATDLRFLKDQDFKMSSLYIIAQFVICAWLLFGSNVFSTTYENAENYLFALDFIWLLFLIVVLYGTARRQKEIVGTIQTINALFELNSLSSFIHGKTINYRLEPPVGLGGWCMFFWIRHYSMRILMMIVAFLCAYCSI